MEFLKVMNLGWVGSLIGLIGLIIAFFLYKASRAGPRPVYQYQALRLIGREEQALPEEVTVLFRDKKVQRLTKTHIIIWNSGKTTVNGENIVADDPLRLEFSKDSEVLSARVIKPTRPANKFTVDINPHSPNEVTCKFGYLDAEDGVVLELLHTAKERCPEVKGSIRGIPKGMLDWGYMLPVTRRGYPFPFRNRRLFSLAVLSFGIGLLAAAFLSPLITEPAVPSEPPVIEWFLIGFGLLYVSAASFMLWLIRRRFPKDLLIEDIE